MKTVAFRCNTGASIGIGHLMRCRAMARHLQQLGWSSVIMGPPEAMRDDADTALFATWLPATEPYDTSVDAQTFVRFCEDHSAEHAVVDDYRAVPAYQSILRKAKLRWLQQFDASKPFDFFADVLVNAGPHASAKLYADYIQNPDCLPLFGPSFAVVRPEFLTGQARVGHEVRDVLVSFGGGDDRGAIRKVVAALSGYRCTVISGAANPANPELAAQFAEDPSVTFLIAPSNIATVMDRCDLAVIAGGTMSYEAAAMGLPFATIALAPNQEGPCQGWARRIGAPYLGQVQTLQPTVIATDLVPLIQDASRRASLAGQARATVDGAGTARLVDALIEGRG